MVNTQNLFIEYATNHGQAIENGDYKLANKLHAKLTSIHQSIKDNENWEELKNILSSSNESVKLWAATFLLKHDEHLGLKALEEVAKSSKIFGLTASTTIDMWHKGML